jgi:hypothetical protein
MSYTRGISEPAGPLMVKEFYSLARRTKGTAAQPRGAHPGLAAHKATVLPLEHRDACDSGGSCFHAILGIPFRYSA